MEGGEAEPAGCRDEQSNKTKMDRGTRQVLARAEREGLSATKLAREPNVSAQKIYWWRQRLRADVRRLVGFRDLCESEP